MDKLYYRMTKREKLRAQVKSRFYYLFWGIATVSVFTGQLFVGCGFRRMAESNDAISADINLLIESIQFQIRQQRYIYDDPMVIK